MAEVGSSTAEAMDPTTEVSFCFSWASRKVASPAAAANWKAMLLFVVGILMMLQKWWPRISETVARRPVAKFRCLSPGLNDSIVAHRRLETKALQQSLLLRCCLHTASSRSCAISCVESITEKDQFRFELGTPT